MTAQVLISHSASTAEIANQIVQTLQVMIPSARFVASSSPAGTPDGGDDALAKLKQELEASDTVIALITEQASKTAEVPFQLGAAWALGKRVVLLLGPDERAAEPYRPIGAAETVVLGPEALIELARSLASTAGVQVEVGPASQLLLMELFPAWSGPARDSSERVVPTLQQPPPAQSPSQPPPSQSPSQPPRGDDTQQMWLIDQAERTEPSAARRPDLPSAATALRAGCAISERLWSREEGSTPPELDEAFGQLLQALGSDWSAVSRLDDVDLWVETADNVLAGLGPNEQQVRAWYDVGYQATLLLNLARRQLELDAPDEGLEARRQGAWAMLRDAAWTAGLAPSELDELQAMLDNLRGPSRDYTNLGRAQARVAGLADAAAQ